MLFAVDIGNSNIVLGLFEGQQLEVKFRLSTTPNETFDEITLKISGFLASKNIKTDKIASVIICSVVPQMTGLYLNVLSNMFGIEPIIVGPGVKTGISILYNNPREVGADRIANAVGGFKLFGGPLIIVDMGTAITFDIISSKGEYVGGVISPGIDTSMSSLSQKAAQLPVVSLKRPKRVIGKSTIESMQSGAVYGFSGMVDSIVRRINDEISVDAKVVATGGHGQWIKDLSDTITEFEPDLTLYGLLHIHLMQEN